MIFLQQMCEMLGDFSHSFAIVIIYLLHQMAAQNKKQYRYAITTKYMH